MHDHGTDADEPEEQHVLGELLLEAGLLHRRAAVLDDERLALERADVRQRRDEDLGSREVGYAGRERMCRARSSFFSTSASRACTYPASSTISFASMSGAVNEISSRSFSITV